MWSLHAEQTCPIDSDQVLLAKGLARVANGQAEECGSADAGFKLYSESNRNDGQETTCDLKCIDGWYRDATPTMSCGDGANRTTASGAPSYTECERKWGITNRSHNECYCLSYRWLVVVTR